MDINLKVSPAELEAKGKESKRVTEAISDWALDTAKQ